MRKYIFKHQEERIMVDEEINKETGEKTYNHRIVLSKPEYYGIVSPYRGDYLIMSHRDSRHAIFHTESELTMVQHLLDKNGIKCSICEVVKNSPKSKKNP
jgi:hypothetical protein